MRNGVLAGPGVLVLGFLSAATAEDQSEWIVRPRSAICPSPFALREAEAAAEARDTEMFRETGCIVADGSQRVRVVIDGNRNDPNAALRVRVVTAETGVTAYVRGQNVVRRKSDGKWVMLPCERVGGWLCDPKFIDDLR